MEENEINVFADDQKVNKDNSDDNISRPHKGDFQRFAEESTFCSVDLDEVDEITDHEHCANPNMDGVARRTPSTVSSEAPVKAGIVLEWHTDYFCSPEGILRLVFLLSTVLSLAMLTSAGNSNVDVLDMSVVSSVRAHIFIAILTILTIFTCILCRITTFWESFPVAWNTMDVAIHGCLCTLLLFSSAMLLRTDNVLSTDQHPITYQTKVHLALAAIFGFLGMFACVFICISRFFVSVVNKPSTSDDIALTSLQSSS